MQFNVLYPLFFMGSIAAFFLRRQLNNTAEIPVYNNKNFKEALFLVKHLPFTVIPDK